MSDFAYMAGIVDGEGSILLIRRGKNSITPGLSVDSTDKELLDWIKETFGGHITQKNLAKDNHKACWTWRVTGDKAISVCELILPFLKIKRRQLRATLLVKEYKNVIRKNGFYSEEQWNAREQMIDRFLSMK